MTMLTTGPEPLNLLYFYTALNYIEVKTLISFQFAILETTGATLREKITLGLGLL